MFFGLIVVKCNLLHRGDTKNESCTLCVGHDTTPAQDDMEKEPELAKPMEVESAVPVVSDPPAKWLNVEPYHVNHVNVFVDYERCPVS